jgi:hypothetical protein
MASQLAEAGALKRVVTWQIAEEMKHRRISRSKLANRMKTSRVVKTKNPFKTPSLIFADHAGSGLNRLIFQYQKPVLY